MATVTHATMHCDHKQWISENDMWRCDISSWQEELRQAASHLAEVEAALKEHEKALQVHAAAIRLRQQDLAAHERALAEYEGGETGAELIALAQSHGTEASKHSQQRDAHERIKRHHHAVIAQVNSLRKALGKPL